MLRFLRRLHADARVLAIAALTMAALGSSSDAVGGAHRAPDVYRGQTAGANPGTVTLKVHREHGRPGSASFLVRDVEVTCEDGTVDSRTPVDATDLGFHGSRRSMDGWRHVNEHPLFDDVFLRIHGRLLADGRATGYILLYIDGFADPDAPRPDCSSGRLPWTAQR